MRMERELIRIARQKLGDGDPQGKVLGPRLGTGGHYGGIFLWDTAFTVLWARYFLDDLPVERSLDNLYRLQDDAGFICREYTWDGIPVWPKDHPVSFAPPVLTWAELDLYGLTRDLSRLKRVYPCLRKHHQYCVDNFKGDDGLFIGDPWGTGMDNLPRWPRDYRGGDACMTLADESVHPSIHGWYRDVVKGSIRSAWNSQGRYIDMSAQMAFDARCLERMAILLRAADEARQYAAEHAAIGAAINDRCWSDTHHFYFDLGYGAQTPRFHVGAYWALIADIVPSDRLEKFITHLIDPRRFARPVPVPCLAADDPDYRTDGCYWQGSSWPPTTYMVLRGLRAAGANDMARQIAKKYVDAVRTTFDNTGTFWESMSPESPVPGNPSCADYCGWAGLGPVAITREFLI